MLKSEGRLLLLTTVIGALLLGGCSTPNPAATYASQGRKFYGKGLIPEALDSFNRSTDYDASVMAGKRYAKQRVMYEESQIQYGLEQAKATEDRGDLTEAMTWYYCVAQVNPERAECTEARAHAERIEGALPASYLGKAREALAQGDKIAAHDWALRAFMATGDEEAQSMLDELAAAAPFDGQASTRPVPVSAKSIQPPVRTDLLAKVTGRPTTMVDGVHVFYGEPVAYYQPLDTTRLEGYPNGVLPILAARAKRKGGDALVNVSVQHKGETAVTSATIAKMLQFESESDAP